MKWTTRLLFLLAVSLSAAVIAMVSGQRSRTPGSSLDSIAVTIERDNFNHETILRSLDHALSEVQSTGDEALQIRALTLRGDLLLKIGAAEAARADFLDISFLQGTPDEALLLRLAEADVLAGNPTSGQTWITALLELNPESTEAHVKQARLSLASAQEHIDACNEILEETLAHDEAQLASTLVDRLAAQDLLDTHRAGAVSSLRELFTESDGERLARVLMKCDSASIFSREARESLEVSFMHGSDPVGVYEYVTLLIRADQPEKAMRFGAQIRSRAEIATHHPTSLQLIRAHLQANDAQGAGTLAAELIQATRNLSPREYADCCRALLAAERWSGLFYASSRMRSIGTSVDGTEASLYLGLAQQGRKRFTNARNLLRSFATSNIPAPYPGAYYEAWATLADLDRASGVPFAERESIHAALQLDPDGPGSSELWVRLGELQHDSGHTSPLIPLSSYSEALCRKPKRYKEVFDRFEEIGSESIATEGRDLELIYQDLRRERRSLPSIPLDAYSLLHLARRHAQDNNYLAVISVCRRLLDNLPNFLPAIDLMIDARLRLGRIRSATEQIVGRIDSIGLDKDSRLFVRRLPLYPSPYSTAQLHRVMRADPAWTGRLEIARGLSKNGKRRAALTALEKTPDRAASSSEASLLSAQIHAELGERNKALELLASIEPEDPDYAEAMLLSAGVASLAGDMDALDSACAALLNGGNTDKLQALVEQLLFDRRIEKAKPILDALKELTGEVDPWHLDHTVLLHVVQGNVREARNAASRAEAFIESARAPLGLVLASTIAVDPRRLATESVFLLDQYPQFSTPVAEAILTLFAGDPDKARSLIDEAVLEEGAQPEWILVAVGCEALGVELGDHAWSDQELAQARRLIHGSPGNKRDPHTVLGVILAAQNDHFAPYALEKLNQFTEGDRSAWDSYLIAKTLRTGGEEIRARNALWNWVQPDSDYFPPAWGTFEEIELARLGSYDHPQFDVLRLSRIRSRAKSNPRGLETRLARSYDALEAGDLRMAARAARAAHDLDGTDHAVNAAMARVITATGDHIASLSYWLTACEHAPPSHRPRYVTGALESVNNALSTPGTKVLPSVTSGVLESLSRFAPEDPRIPLALARLDLRLDDENPALGVARAFRRLENFLRKVDEDGLADIHAGTESDWLDFYLQYGPEQALEFCQSQLLLSPGALSLWLGEIRALRTLGRYKGALRAAAVVHQMAPSGELYEEIAACLQASGGTTKQVEAQLAKAQRLSGELSINAMLTRTKSLLDVKGERTASQAIGVLSRVWDQDAEGALNPTESEVALLLSEGFMKRGKTRDFHHARTLLNQVVTRAQDPYDRTLAKALSGLCDQEIP